MAVHHGLGLRHRLVDLQVHENLAGAGPSAGQLLPGQIDHAHILRRQVVLAGQRRSADDFVGTNAVRNIAAVAVHVLAHPELAAHGADFLFGGLGFGAGEERFERTGARRCSAGTRTHRDAAQFHGFPGRRRKDGGLADEQFRGAALDSGFHVGERDDFFVGEVDRFHLFISPVAATSCYRYATIDLPRYHERLFVGASGISISAHRVRQRKRHISARDPALRSRSQSHLRGGAEDHILPPANLVDGRYPFEGGVHLLFPKYFAILNIERADFTISRTGKDQPSGGYNRAHLWIMGSGILAARGIKNTGSHYPKVGPVVTAGGLIFTGTRDRKVRALDVENGKVLWEKEVDAALEGIPAIYEIGGRQYVVFCASAQVGLTPATQGRIAGAYVAFAMPNPVR